MPDVIEEDKRPNVFIRSYFDHGVYFESAKVVIPSKAAKPSTIEVTAEQFDILMKCDEFVATKNADKNNYRIVNSMPRDQVDLIERISAAQDDVDKAKAEVALHKAEAEKARADFEVLKAKVDADGGDIANEVLDKLKEEKDLALAEIEDWKVKFEELKLRLVQGEPKTEVVTE